MNGPSTTELLVDDQPNHKRRMTRSTSAETNANNTSNPAIANPTKRVNVNGHSSNGHTNHSEAGIVKPSFSDQTSMESSSTKHAPLHLHHHPPSIEVIRLDCGTIDGESLKALSTPSRSFHVDNAAASADNKDNDDEFDIGFPEVSEMDVPPVKRLGSASSWDHSNGLDDFFTADSSKVVADTTHGANLAALSVSIDVVGSLDTLQDMATKIAHPVSYEKVDFSLTSDSAMMDYSLSNSQKYNETLTKTAALPPAPKPASHAAVAVVSAEPNFDVAMSTASLDLFDLDLLDIDNLNKGPTNPGDVANIPNVFGTRMDESDRSSSIGSNTIISWNEDVPDPANHSDMDLMLDGTGIANGKFSESPHSAFVNTAMLHHNSGRNLSRNSGNVSRNSNGDIRAKTFVRNTSNNTSNSNISVESNRSNGSKTKRFSTKQPQDTRKHINNHYKDPLFQPTPNIFNYDQLHDVNNDAMLTASNLQQQQQQQQDFSFPTVYAPHNYRDKDVRSNGSNNSRPSSVQSAKSVSPVSETRVTPPQKVSPTESVSPALQLQMQAMHLQQQLQPFPASAPVFATEQLQQQYLMLQQQQLAQQQALLLQQQAQQQALLQHQKLIQQQLLSDASLSTIQVGFDSQPVSPANRLGNSGITTTVSNAPTNTGLYAFPTSTLPDHPRVRALSDTSSVMSSVTNSSGTLNVSGGSRPEKIKRDQSNASNTNRGNYRCGRCGQPKVNHVCEFIDTSMVSVETQVFMPIVADSQSMTLFTGDKFIAVTARRTIDEDYCQPVAKRCTPIVTAHKGGSTPVLGDLQSRSNSSTELVPSRPNSGAFGAVIGIQQVSRPNSGTFELNNPSLNSFNMNTFQGNGCAPYPTNINNNNMYLPNGMINNSYSMQNGFGQTQQSPRGPIYNQISNSMSTDVPQNDKVDLDPNFFSDEMIMELMDTFDDGPLQTPQMQPLRQHSDDIPQLTSAVSSNSYASSLESSKSSSSTINMGNNMHRADTKVPFNFSLMCSTEKSREQQPNNSEVACTTFFCGSL